MLRQLVKKLSFVIGYYSAFIKEENLKKEALLTLAVLFLLLLFI